MASDKQLQFDKIFSRPIPNDLVGKAKRMAADLAEGSLLGYWTNILVVDSMGTPRMDDNRLLVQYLEEIWIDQVSSPIDDERAVTAYDLEPLLTILIGMGYLKQIHGGVGFVPSEKAFDLLGAQAIEIFISYSVSHNSSEAMLIWSELHRRGYTPFIDIRNISAGDEWHGLLKNKIQSSDIFIVLLGPETLSSSYVRKEIQWAHESKTKIIPISLDGFELSSLESDFSYMLEKNFIRVNENTSVEFVSMINQLMASLSLFG